MFIRTEWARLIHLRTIRTMAFSILWLGICCCFYFFLSLSLSRKVESVVVSCDSLDFVYFAIRYEICNKRTNKAFSFKRLVVSIRVIVYLLFFGIFTWTWYRTIDRKMRDSSVGRTTTTTISSCEWNKKNPLNILTQNTTLYPLLHTIHWPVFAFLFRSFPFITANPNFAFISSWLLYFLPFRVVTVLTSNQIGKQQKAEGWRKRGGGRAWTKTKELYNSTRNKWDSKY